MVFGISTFRIAFHLRTFSRCCWGLNLGPFAWQAGTPVLSRQQQQRPAAASVALCATQLLQEPPPYGVRRVANRCKQGLFCGNATISGHPCLEHTMLFITFLCQGNVGFLSSASIPIRLYMWSQFDCYAACFAYGGSQSKQTDDHMALLDPTQPHFKGRCFHVR